MYNDKPKKRRRSFDSNIMPFGGIYRGSQICEIFQALQKRLPLLVVCFVGVLALTDNAHFSDATAVEFTWADIKGGMIRDG